MTFEQSVGHVLGAMRLPTDKQTLVASLRPRWSELDFKGVSLSNLLEWLDREGYIRRNNGSIVATHKGRGLC